MVPSATPGLHKKEERAVGCRAGQEEERSSLWQGLQFRREIAAGVDAIGDAVFQ